MNSLEHLVRWVSGHKPPDFASLVLRVNEIATGSGSREFSHEEIERVACTLPELEYLYAARGGSVVLVVPDIHEPFSHPQAKRFMATLAEQYQPTDVMFIGDIVDLYTSSRYPKHPASLSPRDEMQQARMRIGDWHNLFPQAKMCIGNHDLRTHRIATDSGIGPGWLVEFQEYFDLDGWEIAPSHMLDGVLYRHGADSSGCKNPAAKIALEFHCNCVQGHWHTKQGVEYNTGGTWGLQVGCLVDHTSYPFDYHAKKREFKFGAAVVINGEDVVMRSMPNTIMEEVRVVA